MGALVSLAPAECTLKYQPEDEAVKNQRGEEKGQWFGLVLLLIITRFRIRIQVISASLMLNRGLGEQSYDSFRVLSMQ